MKWPLFTTTRQLKKALKKCQEELEAQAWGINKTNDAIKLLYKELAEKNKKLQELDQLKSDFVSTVSHELRTPLTTMKEFASIIADEIPGKLNDEQKEYVGIIKGNIDRLARLINDLLDISKIEAGKLELRKKFVNIVNLAEDVVLILKPKADEKDISLKTSFQGALPEVYIDPDKIIQVFTNLIGNAIKFTPRNGEIVVELIDKSEEVECRVTDTGVGISPENLEKVFKRFQQFNREAGAGAKGTGLGLAITKELVNTHNGEIWVESQPGKGTKFAFTLPKHTAAAKGLYRGDSNG